MEKYSNQYIRMVVYHDAKGAKVSLTRTQHEFGEFLLSHMDEVGRMGDMSSVFELVRDYVKHGVHSKN